MAADTAKEGPGFYNFVHGQSFDDWLTHEGQVWVVYGTAKCPSCRVVEAEIEQLLQRKAAIHAVYVDINVHRGIAYHRKITAVPSIEFFHDGQRATAFKAEDGAITSEYLEKVYRILVTQDLRKR